MSATRISRNALRSLLKNRKYTGQLSVANAIQPSNLPEFVNLPIEIPGVTVTSVLRGADLDEVKEFMKGGFYTTALQCKALRLGELSNEEGHIVDQEIEMLLRSGSSKLFRDAKTKELIAVNLSCFWRVDQGYETFPVDLIDWYNASFDVAMEEGDSDHDVTTLARDFHYQLIYHIYQTEAQRQGKDVIFHSGAMFVRQDFRGGAMVAKLSEANLFKKPDCVFVGLVFAYPGYEKMLPFFGNFVRKLGYAPYSGMELRWKNGELAYERFKEMTGISIYGSSR